MNQQPDTQPSSAATDAFTPLQNSEHEFPSKSLLVALTSLNPTTATTTTTRPSWKKLLYIRQNYPDNYVDHSFLKQMKKNVNVRQLRYGVVVCESFRVSQQLSVIMVFVAAFVHLLDHKSDDVNYDAYDQHDGMYIQIDLPLKLIIVSCIITAVLYVFWFAMSMRSIKSGSAKDGLFLKIITSVVLFFTMLLGLTPILKNLTKDISSDSIWFMTIIMFLANMLFHDYGSSTLTHARFPDSLSINAAMFASALLASRLASNSSVFSLMLFAVQLFALFPILRRSMRAWFHPSALSDGILSAMLISIATALIWPISHVACTFYIACMAFVTFFCPYLLVSIQKYKSEIRGPWDEAVPRASN